MAPKKKGNKRQEEDWEADLGESAPAVNDAPAEENGDAEANGDDDQMGGGLLAALKKNRSKKAKKGKVQNDFVEGEDAAQADANGDAEVDFASKAPQEGTFDDEDDVFAGKPKKGKPAQAAAKTQPVGEEEDGGKVKSKKEKEKEKKEREKQRKKEQVSKPLSRF
jgi:translation initiation factor 5B